MKIDKVKYYIENNPNKQIRFNGFSDNVSKNIFFDLHDDHRHYYDIKLMENVFEEIDSVPSSENFYYPLVFIRSDMKDMVKKHLSIPNDILTCVRSGQCKILVQSVQEGWAYSAFIDIFIDNIIKKFNLKPEHFVLLTGNYLNHSKYKAYYHSVWELGMLHHWNQQTPEQLDKIRPYKYICLNRRPEMHRLAIATMLTASNEPGILTLAKTGGYGDNQWDRISKDFINRFPDLKSTYLNNIKPNIPLVYNDGINPETTNPNYDDAVEKFHNSYLHIVTETNTTSDQLFFSEKIFKPIIHWQPFVVVGNVNSLELLRKFGYETFWKYIDERYDSERDTELRIRKINRSVAEFINKPAEELTILLQEMKPIFEHNMQVLKTRSETTCYNNTKINLSKELAWLPT